MADLGTHVAEEGARIIREQVEAETAEAQHWNQELRLIDPGLSIVWGKEKADDPWVSPGKWMIQKEVPGEEPLLLPFEGPNGEFRVLNSSILDFVREADMWDGRNRREREFRKQKLKEAKRRQKAREDEQREDELALALRAGQRLRGDSGMKVRTDLKDRPEILAEKREQRGQE